MTWRFSHREQDPDGVVDVDDDADEQQHQTHDLVGSSLRTQKRQQQRVSDSERVRHELVLP